MEVGKIWEYSGEEGLGGFGLRSGALVVEVLALEGDINRYVDGCLVMGVNMRGFEERVVNGREFYLVGVAFGGS